MPPYVIFGDATLRGLARVRPSSLESMQRVRGVGEKKLEAFGDLFLEAICEYCQTNDQSTDAADPAHEVSSAPRSRMTRPNPRKDKALEMFAQGASAEEVAQTISRAMRTTWGYLIEYVEKEKPASVSAWVADDQYERIIQATVELAADRLRPIFDHLNGEVPYEQIRLVLAHHRATQASDLE